MTKLTKNQRDEIDRRIGAARRALETYAGDEAENEVLDLITDLLHYYVCEKKRAKHAELIDSLISTARMHFEAEQNGEY